MVPSPQDALARCSGMFGTLTLFEDHLAIDRGHFICDLHEVVLRSHPVLHSRIRLDEITDFGVLASMVLPPLFVVRYAGCSQLSGSALHDAVLENVHMLSLIDNRPFYDLLHLLEGMVSTGGGQSGQGAGDRDGDGDDGRPEEPSDPKTRNPALAER